MIKYTSIGIASITDKGERMNQANLLRTGFFTVFFAVMLPVLWVITQHDQHYGQHRTVILTGLIAATVLLGGCLFVQWNREYGQLSWTGKAVCEAALLATVGTAGLFSIQHQMYELGRGHRATWFSYSFWQLLCAFLSFVCIALMMRAYSAWKTRHQPAAAIFWYR